MPAPSENGFEIYGHRGSPRREIENTAASFEAAIRGGADGFETDLRLLSDRVAVLYHDDELDAEEIESLSSADVVERGHIVQQLGSLADFAGRTTMILEVKRSKWEEVLLQHIARWPSVVVASFDHSTIRWLRDRGVAFPLGITVFGYLVDLPAYAERLGATWCFPGYHYVDRELVDGLHARGIRVVPWTPNREREWERLRAIGCDGIITDLPAEAVAWRDGGGGPAHSSIV
jgi:glycerophosphoryl diester phosphodiesterase